MSLLARRRAFPIAASFALAVVSAMPACAPTPACPTPPPAAAPSAAPVAAASAQAVKQVYRFDYSLSLTEPGKAPVVTEHTLNLQESMPGELRTGKNVPLTTGPVPAAPGSAPAPGPTGRAGRPMPPPRSSAVEGPKGEAPPPPRFAARQDVGFLLRSSFQQNGDAMLLRADAEMSNVDDGGAIVKLVVRGEAPVIPGKQALIASSEDPVTHRKLSLSVTATALR